MLGRLSRKTIELIDGLVDDPESLFREEKEVLQCRHGVKPGIDKGGYQEIGITVE